MTAETIHTCSYECDRPECIRAQRDELAARMTAETSNARGDLQAVLQEMRERQVARRFKSQTLINWADRIERATATPPPPADAEVRVYQCPRCATSMEVDPTAKPEARGVVDEVIGKLPADLTHSQAWPQDYVNGWNEALQLVREELPAALTEARNVR